MNKLITSILLMLALSAGAQGQTVSGESELDVAQVIESDFLGLSSILEEHENEFERIREDLHRLELELARMDTVKSDLAAVKRELTDSLMEVSNVLAVADRNMDAANTTLQAAETAIGASHSYLQVSAIFLALIGLLASFAAWYFAKNLIGKTAEQLVRKLKSNGANGQNDILEEIKNTIHKELYQDAVDSISFVMQNDEFRTKLGQLIDRAVEAKGSENSDTGPLRFKQDSPNEAQEGGE